MNPLRTVGGRLAVALLIVVGGALGIVYLIVVPAYSQSLLGGRLKELRSTLALVVAQPGVSDGDVFGSNLWAQDVAERYTGLLGGLRVVVYSPPPLLEPFSDSNGGTEDVEDDPLVSRAAKTSRIVTGEVNRGGSIYAEAAWNLGSGQGVILFSTPLTNELDSVAVVRRRVIYAGIIATVFATVIGYGLATIFARRIRRLERAAERISIGQFEERVVDDAPDELGQLARAFDRMRQQLAVLDRARGEFIANASHELRTPLFSLGGFLELLANDDVDVETRREFLETMRDQVDRLSRLAVVLLDLSRLDAGQLHVAQEPVALGSLARSLVAEFGPRASATGHILTLEAGAEIDGLGDPQRIAQVASILLDNALVHTPPGTSVEVSVTCEAAQAVIAVRDNGAGIPPEAQSAVFERFYRLGGVVASGSGLGLAIARELASLMGARIELRSKPGETTFSLVVRLPDQPESPARAPVGPAGRARIGAGKGRMIRIKVRPLAVVMLCAFAAALGAAGALLGAEQVGWRASTQMVLVRAPLSRSGGPTTIVISKPVLAGGFRPERIFAQRSPGVVTIYAYHGTRAHSVLLQGSGFVVSRGGVVLTAAHVIVTTNGASPLATPARAVYVQFADGDRIHAAIVGWDPYDDVGVLRVDARLHSLTPIPLGSSSGLAVGQPVAAIGSPFGNSNSLSVGVVSAVDRTIPSLTTAYDLFDAIQTDAPINGGSSGGPLLNADGDAIGINAQIRSRLIAGFEGVGFAVPIDSVKRSLEQLLSHGRVPYAYLGLKTENLTPAIGRRFGYPQRYGAIVATVAIHGPAAQAGIRGGRQQVDFDGQDITIGGDAILAVDGSPVVSSDAVAALVSQRLVPGEVAWLTISHAGRTRVVPVVLGSRPE